MSSQPAYQACGLLPERRETSPLVTVSSLVDGTLLTRPRGRVLFSRSIMYGLMQLHSLIQSYCGMDWFSALLGAHVRCVRRNSNVIFLLLVALGSFCVPKQTEGRREYYSSIFAFRAYVGVESRVSDEFSKDNIGTQGEALGR